jgi:type I restriction enzyme S subunit
MARLKHLLRLQYGSALAADTRKDGPHNVYGSNGAVGTHVARNTKAPAIIVGRKGSFGKVTWAERGGFCIDTAYFVDERHCAGDLRFSHYALLHLKLDEHSKDSAVPGLDRSDAHNHQFDIPDLETQRQIADFLDRETARIDLLIEKRERFAALVAEARDSLVAKMICGENSQISAVSCNDWTIAHPKHWKSERAKVHFRERIEKSVDGLEELLTVSHITGVTTRAEKDVNMFLAETNEGYKIVQPGDIVLNTMWGWMGAMGVSSHFGIISPSYGVYHPTSDAFEPKYLDLMLRSKPFVAEVTRRSKGIHSSRLRIYPDAFLDTRLPVPPREEQVSIMAELRKRTERENALLAKNNRASELLKEYRSALITAAVTGQIDVASHSRSGATEHRLDALQEEF